MRRHHICVLNPLKQLVDGAVTMYSIGGATQSTVMTHMSEVCARVTLTPEVSVRCSLYLIYRVTAILPLWPIYTHSYAEQRHWVKEGVKFSHVRECV